MQIKREYQYHHDYHHYHHPPYPPPYYSEYIQHPIDSLRQQQQQQQYAIPFEVAKSPISMSFATIIGAGTFESRVIESNISYTNNLLTILL